MPHVVFTRNLERHLSCPTREVSGETVRDALQGVFAGNPRLESYLLDDQGRLRAHVSIFVNGELVRDAAKAYDLVYRHGLAVDASGTHLAMGSTTGGLWVSANEGDSWRCLSAHLPPVYAVRFAE